MEAVHRASLDKEAIADGDKKDGVRNSWQKVKIDRRIVAIAQVARCGRIVTGEPDAGKIAGRAAIETTFVRRLDLPPEDAQIGLQLATGDEPPLD